MHVLITGGSGLVGSALLSMCPSDVTCTSLRSSQANLTDYTTALAFIRGIHSVKPIDAIFHCAARVGGLYRNMREPVEMIGDNVLMNTNILKIAHTLNIQKVVCVLSTCIFPDKVDYPIQTKDLHNGPPHFSNEGYAYAKRLLEVQCRAYQRQYNRQYFCIVPTNVYGTGDNFDPQDSHVVPALIRKGVIAQNTNTKLHVSGNGTQYRQFINSKDLANIMWWALENYCIYDTPLVCCPPEEIQIKTLVDTIASILGVEVEYDEAEGGQMRKTCTDTNSQLASFGIHKTFSFMPLEDGLKEAITWYKMHEM